MTADEAARRERCLRRQEPFRQRLDDLLWMPTSLVPPLENQFDPEHQEMRRWLVNDQMQVAVVELRKAIALAADALEGVPGAQEELGRVMINGLVAAAVATAEIYHAPLDHSYLPEHLR